MRTDEKGLLIRARYAQDLARVVRRTLAEPGPRDHLRPGLPRVVGMGEHVAQVERLYAEV